MSSELQIDIGNSYCKWRLKQKNKRSLFGRMKTQRLKGNTEKGNELALIEIFKAIIQENINSVEICSVASTEVNAILENHIVKVWKIKPRFFQVSSKCSGVVNSYADPKKMGADRWLASIAASNLYPKSELCIVDCGSATNVEFISSNGHHMGGYIVPGLYMMQQSLLNNTARVQSSSVSKSVTPGTDTGTNVANGSCYITLALLEKLQKDMNEVQGKLLITGGGADFFKEHMLDSNVYFLSDLVLDGFDFI